MYHFIDVITEISVLVFYVSLLVLTYKQNDFKDASLGLISYMGAITCVVFSLGVIIFVVKVFVLGIKFLDW